MELFHFIQAENLDHLMSKNIKREHLKVFLSIEVKLCTRLIYCFSLLFLSVMQLYPYFKQLVSFFPPLQIEVVNTFKSGTSFQGALRRQSSVTSQTQDVTNISSPSHVSLSNALSSPTSTSAAAAGRECVFLMHQTYRDANLRSSHFRLSYFALSHLVLLLVYTYPETHNMTTLCTVDTLHDSLQVLLT